MARAKKREDGRYAVSLSLPGGKRKYFYSTESHYDAERKKEAWLKAHPDGRDGGKIDQKATVEGWSKTWLNSYKGGLEESTRRWYGAMLCSVNSFVFKSGMRFGDMKVADVRPIHVQEYINALSGASKSAIRAKKVIVKSIFDAAVENRIIDVSPAERMPKVTGTYEGHKALTRQEMSMIQEAALTHRFGLPAMIMMWAGLRKQECFALRKKDIDFDQNMIHVSRALDMVTSGAKVTKTENSVRDIPIFSTLQLPLRKALKGLQDNDLLFTKADGTACNDKAVRRALESFLKHVQKVAGEDITFTCHDLRDTFATMCYDAGVDVQTTAKWMGHADITTTMKIYTKLSAEKHTESTDRMESFLSQMSAN